MSENLDNLLVEAFSNSLFKDCHKDNEEDREEGEIESGDDNRDKSKKSKHKTKSKHKSKTKSKSDSKSKKLKSKNESISGSKLSSKKTTSKTSSKSSSKTNSNNDSKSKSKKTKISDKTNKKKEINNNNEENESEVMKLLLSKQMKSYADIQFADEKESPEKEIPKKSKHKSSKKEAQKDSERKHKKWKYSDHFYEKQNDSYYSTHSSTTHEDYFYGSYYEGTEESSSKSSRSRPYRHSRPLSPLYESEWKQRSRSRSPIEYNYRNKQRRGRSISPTERRGERRRSVTPFFKDCYTNARHRRRSLSPSTESNGSNSVDRVDKQKLLEIARINLIKMIERGDLPKGTDINKLKLRHLRELTTQKSVQQWTEFCRAISTLESGAYDSDSDDFDSDDDDIKSVASDQPFSIRHPFKLNERKDIQIRGFPQLPTRTAKELSQELREQFPVSSGNQHRRKESDWTEVELMPPPALPAPKKAKKIETKLSEILNSPKTIPEDTIAYKIIPPTSTTTVTTPTTTTTTSTLDSNPSNSEVITTTVISTTDSTSSANTLTDSDSTQNTSSDEKSDSVFPSPSMPIDIGSVMAQRLSAMRKLQEDPHNVVALKQMFQANQMMTEWAESKIIPGQFTGSTGASILTPQQLTGSSHAWTRKDQLKTAAPITDGIGMLLLLKMGWTPGKGLGKNNEGCVDPIMLDIKNDTKGLVAEDEKVRNLPLQLVSTAVAPNPKGETTSFLSKPGKNPISILHELCAKKKWLQPEYQLANEVGPDHKKNFTFKVILNGVEYQPSVSSPNKKQAKALAAGVCLQAFGLLPKDNT